MSKNIFVPLGLALLLTSCVDPVGPQDSQIKTNDNWIRLQKDSSLIADDKAEVEHRWWESFNDPVLTELIGEALANNKNLGIAKARVEEARANRSGAVAELLPQLYGTGTASRVKQGYLFNQPIGLKEATVQASWELDLFGKNQARSAAAKAIVESEEANRQAVMVSLLAEVARNYFDMRNFEKQVQIVEQNLENQRKTLKLTKDQFEGAILSDFDVQRAAAQVSTTEADVPRLRAAYEASLNRLSVLLGATPGTKDELLKKTVEQKALSEKVVVSAPAKVLANRPDVRAAERIFAASISESDSATRELFPTISLSALYGIQDATTAFAHPWSLVAGVTQPLLNFGQIQAGIDAADAREQQAFLGYQQTVLEAVEDMENALSSYAYEGRRNSSLTDAVTQTQKARDLSKEQFTNGYNGLLDVLVSERDVLAAESAKAASDAELRKSLVHIYTAAGGGWDIETNVGTNIKADEPKKDDEAKTN